MKIVPTNKLFVLFIMLVCFVGQSVATTFSCKNMALPDSSTESMSMVDCHKNMQSNTSLTSADQNTDNNCEEKCNCCAKICASTSLFLASFIFQKSLDASIPFFSENNYSLNTNSLYRPPIL